MKRNKLIIVLIAALIVLTAVFAVIHLTTRDEDREGIIFVEYNGNETDIPVSDLNLTDVSGTTVNGKGEVKEISSKGILLRDLLAYADIPLEDISKSTVIASDEYRAEVTSEELSAEKVYLIITDDNTLRLIVFGDENSKRDVKNVSRIIAE